MFTVFVLPWLLPVFQAGQRLLQRWIRADVGLHRPNLHQLWQHPERLPLFVRESSVAMRYLHFLGPLEWACFPERDLERNWGMPTMPYAPFAAACLVKVDRQLRYMSTLRQYLVDHPALTWILGFPLVRSASYTWGFDVDASLPSHRHFTRMLRTQSNAPLQVLLDSSVRVLRQALPAAVALGESVSLDTKHILAWVKANNPKAYVTAEDRYDKERQPSSDSDCRLGCKKRHNQKTADPKVPPTPLANPVPANTVKVGEFYWGYASGVVATKVPKWGEFVLAEYTQPFNCADVSDYFPLMEATTRRLGRHPKFGAFDAAFDAFYVYEDFYAADHDGFAAVPLSERGPHATRSFDAEGRPLCKAGLSMPLKATFWCRTSLVEHQKGRYACPLLFPQPSGSACPIQHKQWATGGCLTTMPLSIGARIRHQLDRESAAYKAIYKQRTATERINSQAVELGIERPKIRNQQAISNQNTLIYIVINLRGLQRVQEKVACPDPPSPSHSSTR